MDGVAATTELAGLYRSRLCSPFRFRTGVRPVSGRGEDCVRIDCLVCASVFANDPPPAPLGAPMRTMVRVMGQLSKRRSPIPPQLARCCAWARHCHSVGSQSASEDRIIGLNGDFDWNRTRIDGISRARAWSGLGIFNYNLMKIP